MSLEPLSRVATTTDPTADLRAAMHEYEAALTDEQKAQLQSYGDLPSASAVIEMVKMIDEANGIRRNCVGVRLHPFLDSVRQFVSVIGAFLGPPPTVPTLVWGGVKFAMLMANRDSEYFNRISTMVMHMRNLCPHYSEYSILYKDSPRVQRALCNYFAAVIRLCKKIVEFSQRSGISRFAGQLANAFEREFGPLQVALETLGRMVSKEITLASHKAQKEQREQDEKYQIQGYKFRDVWNLERKEAQERRHQVQLNMESTKCPRVSAKRAFTSTLKLRSQYCLEAGAQAMLSRHLFIVQRQTGIPVLGREGFIFSSLAFWNCAGIITHLKASKPSNHKLAYFFCRYDDWRSRQAREVVGSIAQQLIGDCMEDSDDVSKRLERLFSNGSTDIDLISENLAAVLSPSYHYYVILDGIEECDQEERNLVFKFLKSVFASPSLTLKILCSTRPVLDKIIAQYLPPDKEIKLSGEPINSDIEQFIDFTLEEKLEHHELQLGDPGLRSEIREALREKVDGMFLWVVFQIEDICAQDTDVEIREVIRNLPLPHNLPFTFERILKRLSTSRENEKKRAAKIFKWLIVVKRPLTIYELREAIGIEPYQARFEPDKLSNDIFRTLSSCGSLIVLDEEDHTVHFAHHSVREFILSSASEEELNQYRVSILDAEVEASSVCLTYLNFIDFNRPVARTCSAEPLPQVTAFLQDPIPSPGNVVSKVARRALGYRRRRGGQHFNIFRVLQEAENRSADLQQWDTATYSFLPYVSQYWLDHIRQATPEPGNALFTLFALTLQRRSEIAKLPWTESEWNFCSSSVLEWIVDYNHVSVLRVLLSKSPRPSAKTILEIVELVVSKGRYLLWDVLMQDFTVLRSFVSPSGETGSWKDDDVLDKVAEILSTHGSFKPPLSNGTSRLQELRPFRIWGALREARCILFPTELSELPFEGSVLPDLESLNVKSRLTSKHFVEEYEKRWHWISSKPWTDLDLAVVKEDTSVIEGLLATQETSFRSRERFSRVPLLLMAVLGRTDLIASFVKHKNVYRNCKTPDGFTPLMIMTSWSDEEAISKLIHAGANPALTSRTGWNALMIAGALDLRRQARIIFDAMWGKMSLSMTKKSFLGSFRATSNLVMEDKHRIRVLRFEDAMQNLNQWFSDPEAGSIFAPISRRLVTEPLVTEPLVTEPLVTEPLVTEPWIDYEYSRGSKISDRAEPSIDYRYSRGSNYVLADPAFAPGW